MSEIIKQGWYEKFERYEHSFKRDDDSGCGFNFPCTKTGELFQLSPEAQANYDMCVINADKNIIDEGIQDWSYEYRHHPTMKCSCGNIFELDGDSMGEVDCENCGRVYNIFGQELNGHIKPFSGMNEYGEYY